MQQVTSSPLPVKEDVPPAMTEPALDDARSTQPVERLLEDSWNTRSRRVSPRELLIEGASATLFLALAVPLAIDALASSSMNLALAGALVVLYAISSRFVQFPLGAGYVVPSYMVLVPMLLLLPPGTVPLLAALGLAGGTLAQMIARREEPGREAIRRRAVPVVASFQDGGDPGPVHALDAVDAVEHDLVALVRIDRDVKRGIARPGTEHPVVEIEPVHLRAHEVPVDPLGHRPGRRVDLPEPRLPRGQLAPLRVHRGGAVVRHAVDEPRPLECAPLGEEGDELRMLPRLRHAGESTSARRDAGESSTRRHGPHFLG